jgi:hypothetical protein
MRKVLRFPTLSVDPDPRLTGCDDSQELAAQFIASCISALESDHSANFRARFENYVRHKAECEKCNEV